MTAIPSPDWIQRYETLRAHILGSLVGLHSEAWGLVVFIQQGMWGWMRTWQEPPSRATEATGLTLTSPHPCLNSEEETTVLLANMTLRCLGLPL